VADTLQAPLTESTPIIDDCPECGAAGSVFEFFCEVCYAELDEATGEAPVARRQTTPERLQAMGDG
jgi:hypothetical protein